MADKRRRMDRSASDGWQC